MFQTPPSYTVINSLRLDMYKYKYNRNILTEYKRWISILKSHIQVKWLSIISCDTDDWSVPLQPHLWTLDGLLALICFNPSCKDRDKGLDLSGKTIPDHLLLEWSHYSNQSAPQCKYQSLLPGFSNSILKAAWPLISINPFKWRHHLL